MPADATYKLLIFTVILPYVGAYILQRVGLLRRRWARAGFKFNIIFPGTIIAFLGGWGVQFHPGLVLLPFVGFAIACFNLALGFIVARMYKLERLSFGSFVLASGMSNQGYTIGGVICFFFLGQRGYSESLVYLLYWNFFAFLICFPFARALGRAREKLSLKQEVMNIFRDVRSLPLAGLVAGLILAGINIPRPAAGARLLTFAIPFASVISMGCIGLSFQFRALSLFKRFYPGILGIKFIISPLLGLFLAWLFRFEPLSAKVVLIEAMTPAAVMSVLTASLFDLDLDLANALFSVTTSVFLVVVLPILTLLM